MAERRKLVVFDLETTGKDTEVDRILQFSAFRFNDIVEDNGSCEEILTLLINPERTISPEATEVHGYSNGDLIDKPKFEDVAQTVKEFIGDADLGGHNVIAYDIPVLLKEFERVGVPFSIDGRRLIDSLEIFRHILPHTLEGALRFFTGRELVGAHDAEYDTGAASDVIAGELREYGLSMDEAHKISMGDRLTLDGKIIRGEHGPVINFGKQKGQYLGDLAVTDRGLLQWVIGKDFSAETKTYMKKALARDFAPVKIK